MERKFGCTLVWFSTSSRTRTTSWWQSKRWQGRQVLQRQGHLQGQVQRQEQRKELDSDSESEPPVYVQHLGDPDEVPRASIHHPRTFDPVRHAPITVIFQRDNYQWDGEHRDRTWDHDVEAVDWVLPRNAPHRRRHPHRVLFHFIGGVSILSAFPFHRKMLFSGKGTSSEPCQKTNEILITG